METVVGPVFDLNCSAHGKGVVGRGEMGRGGEAGVGCGVAWCGVVG
jgi:hypothetical protein